MLKVFVVFEAILEFVVEDLEMEVLELLDLGVLVL